MTQPHRRLELGRPAFEVAAARSWPVERLIVDVEQALAAAPESEALIEARRRARAIALFLAQSEAESRAEHREIARLYIPDWPWGAVARGPELTAVYRRFLRPSGLGRITGRPPVLWTRFVRDVLVARV